MAAKQRDGVYLFVRWWNPKRVCKGCRLGWQLCHVQVKTEVSNDSPIWLWLLVFLIFDIRYWSNLNTRPAALWLSRTTLPAKHRGSVCAPNPTAQGSNCGTWIWTEDILITRPTLLTTRSPPQPRRRNICSSCSFFSPTPDWHLTSIKFGIPLSRYKPLMTI